MDWKTFCENIKEILELERYKNLNWLIWDIDDKKISIKIKVNEEKILHFEYTKIKYNKDYNESIEDNELSIYNTIYYEVPILIKNDHMPISFKYDKILGKSYSDSESDMQYIIENPSEQFWIKIVKLKIKPNGIVPLRRLLFTDRYYRDGININKKCIFDLFKCVYRDFITLKLITTHEEKKNFFQNLTDAFIFNINYNTDIGMRQIFDLQQIQEKRKSNRLRIEEFDKIDSPKRIYKKELLEQYNMANISEDPFIKYLCYYHILEHFYEIVYKEELVKIIKDQLTLPSFSIKKEKEIVKLIDIIKDKVKIERENFEGNELEALELVIKKFVDLNNLKIEIESLDNELVTYYDKEKVPFSQGVSINFNDKDNLYKNIAKRIYITRNSLVHYKSNDLTLKERRIYRPFNDRGDLLKEVPLIRKLAEDVIINSAQIL